MEHLTDIELNDIEHRIRIAERYPQKTVSLSTRTARALIEMVRNPVDAQVIEELLFPVGGCRVEVSNG